MNQLVESTDAKQAHIPHQVRWVRHRKSRSLEPGRIYVFSDGSSLGSYAAVTVCKRADGGTNVVWEGAGFEPMTKTRNIRAELDGVILGLTSGVPSDGSLPVVLVYDYFGIGAWLSGNWRIKEPEVQERITKLKKIIAERRLKVSFIHHGGHQKDDSDLTKWNNRADQLATARAQAEANIVDGVGGLGDEP